MSKFERGTREIAHAERSEVLKRFTAGVARRAVAILSTRAGPLALASHAPNRPGRALPMPGSPATPRREGGATTREVPLDAADIAALDRWFGTGAPGEASIWAAYRCPADADGARTDLVALALHAGQNPAQVRHFLGKLWPALREDCVRERASGDLSGGEASGLWTILDGLQIGLMILDARGRLVRANAAARRVLEEGMVLRGGAGGVRAAGTVGRDPFLDAVAACLAPEPGGEAERTVFLTHRSTGRTVPVTLSPYAGSDLATAAVVATVPVPPDPTWIETLAGGMGLTASEAKVASLMQLGLTNKQAAACAGFTEQTFNTYAKRVLTKLNAGCRTEVAGLLTWQAAGRRVS